MVASCYTSPPQLALYHCVASCTHSHETNLMCSRDAPSSHDVCKQFTVFYKVLCSNEVISDFSSPSDLSDFKV